MYYKVAFSYINLIMTYAQNRNNDLYMKQTVGHRIYDISRQSWKHLADDIRLIIVFDLRRLKRFSNRLTHPFARFWTEVIQALYFQAYRHIFATLKASNSLPGPCVHRLFLCNCNSMKMDFVLWFSNWNVSNLVRIGKIVTTLTVLYV